MRKVFPKSFLKNSWFFGQLFSLLPRSNSYVKRQSKQVQSRSWKQHFSSFSESLIFLRNSSFHISNSQQMPPLYTDSEHHSPAAGIKSWYPRRPCPAACLQTTGMGGGFPPNTVKSLVLETTQHSNTFSMLLWCYLFPGKHWAISPQALACTADYCLHCKIVSILKKKKKRKIGFQLTLLVWEQRSHTNELSGPSYANTGILPPDCLPSLRGNLLQVFIITRGRLFLQLVGFPSMQDREVNKI